MFLEKNFEDILVKYPELIEDDLRLKGRQITLYGRRIDLLYEDRFKRKLLVELKRGPIKDEHIGQIMSYEGMLLSADDPSIRIMLIGNRVPPNIGRSLDHHGIAWKEISFSILTEFLREKKDSELLSVMEECEEIQIIKNNNAGYSSDIKPHPIQRVLTPDELISAIKESEDYQSFIDILSRKKENEEKARNIILQNLGYINHENLHEVIDLIDEKYPCTVNGRNVSGTWFGRLLNSNTGNLFETDLNKMNNWFNILTNPHLAIEKKFSLLLNEPNSIRGINVGFLTLMLYILDKSSHLIWFEGLHNGIRKIYPERIEKFNGKCDQYLIYNKAAMEFAEKYGFDHTELDWIFSTGVYLDYRSNIEHVQKPLTILQQEYLDFFKLVSDKYKVLTGSFPGKLFPQHYLQIPVGFSGVHFEWTFHGRPRYGLGVELHFEGRQDNNQRAIRYLKAYEAMVCNETGESFIFQEVWGTKWSRIYLEKKDPNLSHELAEWAVDTMIKFQKVLDPLLKEYRYNRKSGIT